MTRATIFAVSALLLPLHASAGILLGTAGDFAVLAGAAVTNTGPSIIEGGHVGVHPLTAITGFLPIDGGPGIVLAPHTYHAATFVALQAKADLVTAFNQAAGLPVSQVLTGTDLGGLTLTPGVYFFASSAQLTGILTLDNLGDPNAEFVFQIGSTITTASNSAVVSINTAIGGSQLGCNVYWQVGSSATLGTGTNFQGHILAQESITMTTGSSLIEGSALAITGAVTLDTVRIANCAIPAPGSLTLAFAALALRRRPSRRPNA